MAWVAEQLGCSTQADGFTFDGIEAGQPVSATLSINFILQIYA